MDHLSQIIEQYGIYAVFALCTVEGDITLLISGAMAHGGFFGKYSFFKVFLSGTLGGMVGDRFGYLVGRIFHENAKDYRFYQMAQPRIEKLIDKFGALRSSFRNIFTAYGPRCAFFTASAGAFSAFFILDAMSCSIWVSAAVGPGYFFSGAITRSSATSNRSASRCSLLILFAVIVIYVIERFWLSERVEEADPRRSRRSRKNSIASKKSRR